jgi:hypothetical protein
MRNRAVALMDIARTATKTGAYLGIFAYAAMGMATAQRRPRTAR